VRSAFTPWVASAYAPSLFDPLRCAQKVEVFDPKCSVPPELRCERSACEFSILHW